MTWATVSDVRTLTGQVVDDAAIANAQTIIELTVELSESEVTETEPLSVSDRRLLQVATAYQAAYLGAHPSLGDERKIARVSEGDITVEYEAGEEDTLVAPMAARAIRRLSWMRTRPVVVSG